MIDEFPEASLNPPAALFCGTNPGEEMPLVRVVIPTYNRAALLGEALNSVLAQTFSDFEVVVADDGSTDDTLTVLHRFAERDPRIRFVTLPHGGVARARNAAIREPGRHRYIAFLDADDLWLPFHLESAVEALEREPSIALFFGWYERRDFTDQSKRTGKSHGHEILRTPKTRARQSLDTDLYLLEASDCLQALLSSDFSPHTPTVVVRRNAVTTEDWFRTSLEVYSDVEFYLRLAANGSKFVYHDVIHDFERRFGDNLTGSIDLSSPILLRRYQSVVRYSQIKLSICRSSEQRNSVVQEIAQAFFIIGECSREQSDLRESRVAYRTSLRYHWSAHALRGFLLSLLPYPMYSLLRNVKTSLRAATLQ